MDEAHYFLRALDPEVARDLSHGGYTLVTYRPADLDDAVMREMGVIIATRHTDPREAAALARHAPVDPAALAAVLATLSVSEAVLVYADAHGPARLPEDYRQRLEAWLITAG